MALRLLSLMPSRRVSNWLRMPVVVVQEEKEEE